MFDFVFFFWVGKNSTSLRVGLHVHIYFIEKPFTCYLCFVYVIVKFSREKKTAISSILHGYFFPKQHNRFQNFGMKKLFHFWVWARLNPFAQTAKLDPHRYVKMTQIKKKGKLLSLLPNILQRIRRKF